MGNSPAPKWNELASTIRSDLAGIGCGRQWYEGVNAQHRLGIVNAYTKMKHLGLWGHVKRIVLPHPGDADEPGSGPDDVGKFEFETRNAQQLRAALTARPDFEDPENVPTGWSSREDTDECSLHFKHFGSDPSRIHVHVDQAGLSWKPQSWFKHLFWDYLGDGWKDVGEVNTMLRAQGHQWSTPVVPRPAPVSSAVRTRTTRPLVFGGQQGAQRLAALRDPSRWSPTTSRIGYSAKPLPLTTQGGGPSFPGVQITAFPKTNRLQGLGHRLTFQSASGVGAATPAPYEFTTRELPGSVRFGTGGRMEFPGVQVTAQPRTTPAVGGGGYQQPVTQTPSASRFDWTVRQIPGDVRFGQGGRMEFPGMEITARPKPNLLRELGQRMSTAPTGYDFRVRQERGPIRPLPGGGMEFPPMHVIATPNRSPNFLNTLGRGLGTGR